MTTIFLVVAKQTYSQSHSNCEPEIKSIYFPNEIIEGERITFNASIEPVAAQYYTCIWEIDNEVQKQTKYGSSFLYKVKEPGEHTVTLTVDCGLGSSTTKSKKFFVKNKDPKIISLIASENEWDHYTYEFKAIAIDPSGKRNLKYEWDFGDGSKKEIGEGWSDVTHEYKKGGAYTVTLTVYDKHKGKDVKQELIIVEDDFTVFVTGAKKIKLSGKAVFFTGHGVEVPGVDMAEDKELFDMVTEEGADCHRAIALFDDEEKSIIFLSQYNSKEKFFGNSFSIDKSYFCDKRLSTNTTDQFTAEAMLNMPSILYKQIKFSLMNVDLYEVDDTSKIFVDPYNDLAKDMLEELNPFKNIFGKAEQEIPWQYISLGNGVLDMQPADDNKVFGKFDFNAVDELCPAKKQKTYKVRIDGKMQVNVNYFTEQFLEECEQVEGFMVKEITPKHEQPNVSFEKPEIQIMFTEKVDRESVNPENIQFGYKNVEGEFVDESYQFEVEDSIVHIIPVSPLEPAVRYDLNVKNGLNGVKSLEGGELIEGVSHWFSTVMEPKNVWVRIYQTIQDAPLIPNKKTLIRTLIDWEPSSEVHSSYQIKSCIFNVEYSNHQDVPNTNNDTIKIQSEYSKDEIRLAKNTINNFDYYPSKEFGEFEMIIVPIPQNVKTNKRIEFRTLKKVAFHDGPKNLRIKYIPVRAFDWADSIPNNKGMRQSLGWLAGHNNDFIEQTFPILKATSRVGFSYATSLNGKEKNPSYQKRFLKYIGNKSEYIRSKSAEYIDELDKEFLDQYIERVCQDYFRKRPAHDLEDFTLLVFPYDINVTFAGKAYTTPWREKGFLAEEFWDKRKVEKFRSMGISVVLFDGLNIESLTPTHEIGHGLTLYHMPDDNDYDSMEELINTPSMTIFNDNKRDSQGKMHGFRLDRYDSRGWNKNDKEGNGENPSFWTLNFMHPTSAFQKPKHYTQIELKFISDSYYYQLMDFLKKSHKKKGSALYLNEHLNTWSASASNNFYYEKPSNTFENMVSISGIFSLDMDTAIISEVTYGNWPLEFITHSNSNNTIKIYENGVERAIQSISIDTTIFLVNQQYFEGLTFETVVPFDGVIDRVTVSKNGTKIADKSASNNHPHINIEQIVINGQMLNVRLSLADKDNDIVAYRAYLSQNEGMDWNYIGSGSDEHFSYTLPTNVCGDNMLLRIEVSDLFHTISAEKAFTYIPNFSAQLVSVKSNMGVNDNVDLMFSLPVNSIEAIYNHLEFKDSAGFDVPYELYEVHDLLWFRIVPAVDLKPNKNYTLTLSKSMKSQCEANLQKLIKYDLELK